jgi:putative membrane protein
MKNNLKSNFVIILKGLIIGSSMSVPGVSGGTMAILLGIYDKLISAVSDFWKNIGQNTIFLLKFCLGAGIGIATLARIITWMLDTFPFPVSFFFLGAVIGGIPALYKKTKDVPWRITSGVYFLLGLVIVIAVGFIPGGSIHVVSGSGLTHYVILLFVGIIIALALVLPGISTSHMLLVLGIYDTMLNAIEHFDIVYIGVIGIFTLVGVFLITKPLEWTMKTYPHETYWIIIGFVLGSTWEIFRDKIFKVIPSSGGLSWWVPSVVFSIATFVLGYIAIVSLARFSND